MAKSTLGVIMALLITTISFANASAFASDPCLPLADKGSIPNITVLADRIDESLKIDSSGNGSINGANITPLGFLEAVNAVPRYKGEESGKYSPTVQTVGELPEYFRHLVKGEMPKGTVSLAGVCEGKLTLGTHEGSGRMAHSGEVGWYDQRGDFILAGDCMNTRIPLQITVNRGLPMRTDPYAGKATPRAYRETTLRGGCPVGNERLLKVSVLEETARENACAKRFILSEDGKLKRPDDVATDVQYTGTGLDGEDLSRTCGAELNKAYKPGMLNHDMEVILHEGSEEFPLFVGTIRENGLTPAPEYSDALVDGFIRISDAYTDGVVEVRFDDYTKVVWPTAFHLRERLSSFTRGCKVNRMTGIERTVQ